MEFEINDTKWTIEIVNEDRINNETKNDNTLGLTIYKEQKILILENQANIIKTLKHELMHVWMYEYGHPQNDEELYTFENVCEIVASSNDFINEIVNKYLGIEPLYKCDPNKNAICSKKSCYINDGECMHTTNRKYALNDRIDKLEYTKQNK